MCPHIAPVCAVLNSILREQRVTASLSVVALIMLTSCITELNRRIAFSVFGSVQLCGCFLVLCWEFLGWESRLDEGEELAESCLSPQTRLQPGVVPMCTIPADINGHYERKVRPAYSDYT